MTTSAGSSGEKKLLNYCQWTSHHLLAIVHTGDGTVMLNGRASLGGYSRCSLLTFLVSILFSQRLAEGLKGFSLLEKLD